MVSGRDPFSMLGQKQVLNRQLQQITDGVLLVAVLWAMHVIRFSKPEWFPFERVIPPFDAFRWLLFLLMPFGPIFLELEGFYDDVLRKPLLKLLEQIARSGLWLALLVGATSFLLRLEIPSRSVILMFAVAATLVLAVRSKLLVAWMRARAISDSVRQSVLLAGSPADVAGLRKRLFSQEVVGIDVVGEFDIGRQPVSELVEALHRHSVGRVIFAAGRTQMDAVQEAIAACETEGVEAWLVANFIKTSIARPEIDYVGDSPMLVFRTTPGLSWALMAKGLIDVVGATVLVVATSPLFLLAALAIRITSPGPILFRQQRAGRHGRPFTMLKFRSMQTDAEMRRAELEAFNQMSGPVFKVEKDPRVTPVGRLLRATSIDELPQLLNVLQGHMSLVGPRPLPIYEVERFDNLAQRRRLSVKPGLTCLWQISGRNQITDFSDWVKLDLQYIDSWSLWLDIKILLQTVPAVLFGRGAK
jgi:exopolysaccharide biosynthesis polyprenyl glycosylphosphotransferase